MSLCFYSQKAIQHSCQLNKSLSKTSYAKCVNGQAWARSQHIALPENLRNAIGPGFDAVFWLEAIAVVAFGIS